MRLVNSSNKFMQKRNTLFIIVALIVGLSFAMTPPQKKKRTTRRAAKTEDNRVYLVHADVLSYDQYKNPDAQILNGHVQFRHNGAKLFCDSAHWISSSNKAFI